MKLRQKPAEFEGEQYQPDYPLRMSGWMRNLICTQMCPLDRPDGVPHIHSGIGMISICSGDWIIQSSEGVLSVCDAAEFEATYEKVAE